MAKNIISQFFKSKPQDNPILKEQLTPHCPPPYNLGKEDQLFFLHIPKTAGTTLIDLLDDHFAPTDICPEQLPTEIVRIPKTQLAKYRFFRGHLDYDLYKMLPNKPVYLTMLRDPVERLISFYNFWKQNSDNWVAENPEEGPVFRKMVENDPYRFFTSSIDSVRMEVVNSQVRRIVSKVEDFHEMLSGEELLRIAKQRLSEEFQFFGLVERFNESLELLSYTLGWRPVRRYERKMVARKKTGRSELDSKALDAIIERNQLDIALYKYAQELFDKRYRDMKYNLLEQHYEWWFAVTHSASDTLDLSFDQPISGDGWYRPEYTESGITYRWMGPEPQAFVDCRLSRQSDYVLTVHISNTIHSSILPGFQLDVNNHQMDLKKLSGNDYSGVFQAMLPASVIEQNPHLVRVTFRVEQTLAAGDLISGSSDSRKLSLACSKIVFTPITAT